MDILAVSEFTVQIIVSRVYSMGQGFFIRVHRQNYTFIIHPGDMGAVGCTKGKLFFGGYLLGGFPTTLIRKPCTR